MYCRAAMHLAVELAGRSDAEIQYLSVLESGSGVVSRDALENAFFRPLQVDSYSEYTRLKEQLDLEVTAITKNLQGISFDPARTSFDLLTGSPAQHILNQSKKSDLLVMGRRGTMSPVGDKRVLGNTVKEVATQLPRPLVISGRNGQPLKNVLLAYDGGLDSAKTMQVLAHLMTSCRMKKLFVISIADSIESAQNVSAEAVDYLSLYDIKAEPITASGKPTSRILQAINDHDINLMAMGGFGTGKLKSFFVGSTTKRVLAETDLPVLMCR
jgi:nucleotide-binding universal stress UspA family protein